MFTVKFDDKQSLNGEKHLFGIGTCRIRDLLSPPSKHKDRLIISGFSHSLGDIIQKLKILNEDISIPKYLIPLVFGTKPKTSIKPGGKITTLYEKLYSKKTTALVIEWSSIKRFQIDDFDINPFYLGSHIVRKGGLEFLEWWKCITNNQIFDSDRINSMVKNRGKIDTDLFNDEELLKILNGLKISNYDFELVDKSLTKIEFLTRGIKLIYVIPYGKDEIDEILILNKTLTNKRNFINMEVIIKEIGPKLVFTHGAKNTDHFEPEMVENLSVKFYKKLSPFIS